MIDNGIADNNHKIIDDIEDDPKHQMKTCRYIMLLCLKNTTISWQNICIPQELDTITDGYLEDFL